jgi:hypothetical protein
MRALPAPPVAHALRSALAPLLTGAFACPVLEGRFSVVEFSALVLPASPRR